MIMTTNSTDTTKERNLDAASSFTVTQKNQPLHDSVRQALENYLTHLSGGDAASEITKDNLYNLVLAEVEVPLLDAVMEYTRGNQSRAAILLGLSRGTLRKKLKIYGMLD